MKAVEIHNPGPDSHLALVERPIPVPGPGEVLIRVTAAGINRADLMQREGHYPPPEGASDIPGLEVSGEVIALGERVSQILPGDLVFALLPGGGYAEYCLAEAELCFICPESLDLSSAAALPEGLFTVWENIFRRGRLAPGETLLVEGGCGGIGSLAVRLAIEFESRVIATAGSDPKCKIIEQWGARAINYHMEDLETRIFELTQHLGVDVILDLVGGPRLKTHLNILKEEGRLVMIAVQGGYRAEINLLPVITRRLTLTGSTLRTRSLEEKIALAREIRRNVWPKIESGRLRPMVSGSFAPDEVEQAHSEMRAGRHIGKMLIRFAA